MNGGTFYGEHVPSKIKFDDLKAGDIISSDVQFENIDLFEATKPKYMAELFSRMRMRTSIEGYGGLGNKISALTLKEVAKDPTIFRYNDIQVNFYNTASIDIIRSWLELVPDPSKVSTLDVYEIIRNIEPEILDRIHAIPVGISPEQTIAYLRAMAVLMNANSFPDDEVKRADEIIDKIADQLNGTGGSMEVGMALAEKSKVFLKKYNTYFANYDFRIGVGSMGGGGSGTALFPVVSELMYQTTPNAIVINNAIMPFADEGSEKFEQFKKSSEMTKPFSNLLIFHNPQKYVGRKLGLAELEQKLTEKPTAFIKTFSKAVTPTTGVRIILDKSDLKSAFGKKGENVGDITYIDNRARNGGYLNIVKMVEEKLELEIKPDYIVAMFEIPKPKRPEEKISIDDIIHATDIIKSGANVRKVIRGVIERESTTPLINAYIVVTKRISDREVEANGSLYDAFEKYF